MPANTSENPLLVFEYGGTARSGKGTIVADIAAENPTIATEETGADYRVLTKVLLCDGMLEPGMPSDVVAATVDKVQPGYITDVISRRNQVVEEEGLPSLYTPEVSGLVSSVSPLLAVRKAVKAGFTRRVETVIGDDEHDVLLVDGRNLAPIIRTLPAAILVMRTFVSCAPIEAALREVARNDIMGDHTSLMEAYASISKRNEADASRTIDPVKPDEDAIDYWWDQDTFLYSSQKIADELYGGDLTRAITETFSGFREYTDVVRHGVGAKAVLADRQVHFDTTFFRSYRGKPKNRMLEAAHAMFDEARVTHTVLAAGLVNADTKWLRYYDASIGAL